MKASAVLNEQTVNFELPREEREPDELHQTHFTRVHNEPSRWDGRKARANGHKPAARNNEPELPQAPEAEKALLASFLLAPNEVGLMCASRGIYPGHFLNGAYRTLFEELQYLHGEHEPINFTTLVTKLRDRGQLDAVGGGEFVNDLFTFLPTASLAEYYAELMLQKYALRQSIKLHTELLERAYREDDVWTFLNEARDRCVELTTLATGKPRTKLPAPKGAAQWALEKDLPPEPPQVVYGLVHQGCKVMITGGSKMRKTWALLDMALSVAAGMPWWGLPTTKGRVLYVNFELPEFMIARRLHRIAKAKGVELTNDLQVLTLRGVVDPTVDLSDELPNFCRREGPFDLIAVDPYYKLSGGRDEIGTDQVMNVLNKLEKLSMQTGAAVAFSHHFSKGNQSGKESMDRASGSGAFARDPDAILTMTAHEQVDCLTVEMTLRNFAPVPAFVVRWDHPLFVRDDGADPTALKQSKGGKTGPRANDAMATAQQVLLPLFRSRRIRRFGEILDLARTVKGTPPSKSVLSKWLDLLRVARLVEKVLVPHEGWQATELWTDAQ